MTLWTPLFCVAVICFAFAIGSFVSFKTKAYISSVIIACIICIAGFLSNIIPRELVVTSGFASMIGAFVVPFCIIDVGSKLRLSQLKQEWKTVVMNLAGTLGIVISVGTIGWLIFGKQYALSSIPPLAGALVATTVVQQQAMESGVATIAVFASIVLVLQAFAGLPFATIALKRELKVMKDNGTIRKHIEDTRGNATVNSVAAQSKMLIPPLPKAWQSDAMILFKIALLGVIANAVAQLTVIPNSSPTNYILNPNVAYVIFAIIAANIGLIERSPLDASTSRGIIYLALLSLLIHSFSAVSGADILAQFLPSIGTILIGAIGIIAACLLVAKLLRTSPWIAIAIGFTCYLGYPGSQVVVEETVKGSDLSVEEQKAANDILIPRMVIGYFVASITSVILAGIIAPMIFS